MKKRLRRKKSEKEIESLNLPGIGFIESYKRYYPNGDFASYILGYAKTIETTEEDGTITSKIVGELGLESKYNEWLTGTDGKLSYQRDRYGYKIPDTIEDRIDAINGANIYLTIDSNVQRFTDGPASLSYIHVICYFFSWVVVVVT